MRFTKFMLLGITLLIGLSFIGCASIIHGSKQEVSFKTTPADAEVTVTDALGTTHGSCQTPCSIKLKRKGTYKAEIKKPGYATFDLVLERKSDGWIWGNIFFGGIIGLIVDFSNGAAYKIEPADVMTTLSTEIQGYFPGDKGQTEVVLIDYELLSDAEKFKVTQLSSIPIPTN